MRTMTMTLTVCTLLACIGATRAQGAEPAAPRTFNVLDYGARGDDATDNTQAFSA